MIEILKIGFLHLTLIDLIDILVVSLIIRQLYMWMKGTIAAQIFLGLLFIVLLSFVSGLVNLKLLNWLLRLVSDVWIIAFIILFQPELRRVFRLIFKPSVTAVIDEIIEAVGEMSQKQIGALIVIPRQTGIRSIIETGVPIQAKVTKELLLTIFFPRSPLHDGAVVISGDRVEAAACTLPLSAQSRIGNFLLGTRHRAALGLSEISDAIVIVVSEETGTISVAEAGKLTRGLSPEGLRKKLLAELQAGDKTPKEIFEEVSQSE
ncbi:diadenylate cyclase CdaA [Candidatus Kryptonium thompsonii]|uniref:diadenylate cyclase CdaA n=1 Tax=Candidatus Kryptonium thompsonii TaxID=1633631 RepID=UPI0007073627|nr:diadenylate cyclase CdaA [Candidatus Kryptonium thompsoni]CUS94889.1 diadenylate cyclase [Candidatus Kryptonium thompsoni]